MSDIATWIFAGVFAVWITLRLAPIPLGSIIAADRAAKAQRKAAKRNAREARRQYEATRP